MSDWNPVANRSCRLIACAIAVCSAAALIGLGSIANALKNGTGNDAFGIGVVVLLVISVLFLTDWFGSWREGSKSSIVEKYRQELKGD